MWKRSNYHDVLIFWVGFVQVLYLEKLRLWGNVVNWRTSLLMKPFSFYETPIFTKVLFRKSYNSFLKPRSLKNLCCQGFLEWNVILELDIGALSTQTKVTCCWLTWLGMTSLCRRQPPRDELCLSRVSVSASLLSPS
jgi:hypothetical protein